MPLILPEIESDEDAQRRRLQQMAGRKPDNRPVATQLTDTGAVANPGTAPTPSSFSFDPAAEMQQGRGDALGAGIPPPSSVGRGDSPGGSDRDQDADRFTTTDDVGRVSDESLDNVRLKQALERMLGGNPVTQEDVDRTRTLGNSATQEELRGFNARLAAGGFGASGIGALTGSSIGQRGTLQTERAVQDMLAGGRSEELQNLMAGAQLADSGRLAESDAVTRGMLQDFIRSEFQSGDESLDGNPSGPVTTEDKSPVMVDMIEQARFDAANQPNSLAENFFQGVWNVLGWENTGDIPDRTPGTQGNYIATEEFNGKTYAIYHNVETDSYFKVRI